MRIEITSRPGIAARSIALDPLNITVTHRPLRILDLDAEARPLHWINSEYVSKEITALAWAWTDAPDDVTCFLLGQDDPIVMLHAFVEVYNRADMVTGHFIRGYDLPMINGAMTEFGLPPLGDKLAHDTKIDLIKRAGLSSSQENLGAMLGLKHPKVQMDQTKWRSANRLEPEGLIAVRERVVGDVQQHIEMRARLLELGYLKPPVLWESGTSAVEQYTP